MFSRREPGVRRVRREPAVRGGKNTISHAPGDGYRDWLQTVHEEASGNADLVAHFFRRAFALLRHGGTFGLIATNTIAQGDTRAGRPALDLHPRRDDLRGRKRAKVAGPGAAVVVSVVHVAKGAHVSRAPPPFVLDGREVERITAFLFHAGGHDDPAASRANAGKSFLGSIVLGMGFTFDDTTQKPPPLAEMERLIAKDPRNAERIFPYIGGEEVNDSPTHAHRRYVINFGEMSEAEARRWPDLMAIVEAKVKPERARHKRGSSTAALVAVSATATGPLRSHPRPRPRAGRLASSSKHLAFVWLPPQLVFSDKLVVFALDRSARVLPSSRSRLHERWARFFGSSLEGRLRTTPPPTASRPSPSRRTGRRTPRSKPPAAPTTTSAPRSWSATTRA